MTAGAGALNSVAAARFAAMPKDAFSENVVAGEATRASGIAFLNPAGRRQQSIASSSTIIWGNAALRGNTIIWGSADTIIWGSTVVGNTIVWGGSVLGSTIIWGSGLAETIIWGS